MKLLQTVILFLLVAGVAKSQVTEDFNHGDRTISQSNCWQTPGSDVQTETWAINSGGDAPMLRTSQLSGGSGELISPFVKFNGTGVITFNHKVNSTTSSPALNVYLLNQTGSVVQTLLTVSYGNTTTIAEEIDVTWTGIYQISWEWTGSGGSSRGAIDDISIHGSYASDPTINVNGACAVKTISSDSVCAGTLDVPYQIYSPVSTSNYTWFLDNPAGGTIDSTLSGNNNQIEIDWGTTPGVYILNVYETSSDGCIGDTVSKVIEVLPLPSATLLSDSVCESDSAFISLTLTGTSPWIVNYTDGVTNYTDTCLTSNCDLAFPGYMTTTPINVLSITDDTGCSADTATLPSGQVYIFPKPTTGAIYH